MGEFWKDVGRSFSWSHWHELSQRPLLNGLGFLSKILLLAFILMLVLAIPKLAKMPGEISEQLAKFEKFQLAGNVSMSSPIKLPSSEPVIILDTSGAYTELTTERLLITQDTIFYRPFLSTHKVAVADLKDVKNNRDEVKTFLAMLAFFLLPSVVFYAYVAVWLKYFLMVLVLSIVLSVLLDLTHWRRTFKELFVIGCFVSTLPLLAEVILGAWNAAWLIPVLSVYGLVKLYLLPAMVLSVLTIGAALCVHYNTKEQEH